jgi:hypothetical protein
MDLANPSAWSINIKNAVMRIANILWYRAIISCHLGWTIYQPFHGDFHFKTEIGRVSVLGILATSFFSLVLAHAAGRSKKLLPKSPKLKPLK